MLLFAVGEVLAVAAFLLVLPPTVRCLPDCRRSWQLRWDRSSEVRSDLIASMHTGRPAATPALARDVLEYVAVMRRGLVTLRSPAYRIAGSLLTVGGLLWVASGLRIGNPSMVVIALLTATYPISTWLYLVSLARKLDRAERANRDLAQRPDLYLVHPVGVDCISN